jgi:hypothetical protein
LTIRPEDFKTKLPQETRVLNAALNQLIVSAGLTYKAILTNTELPWSANAFSYHMLHRSIGPDDRIFEAVLDETAKLQPPEDGLHDRLRALLHAARATGNTPSHRPGTAVEEPDKVLDAEIVEEQPTSDTAATVNIGAVTINTINLFTTPTTRERLSKPERWWEAFWDVHRWTTIPILSTLGLVVFGDPAIVVVAAAPGYGDLIGRAVAGALLCGGILVALLSTRDPEYFPEDPPLWRTTVAIAVAAAAGVAIGIDSTLWPAGIFAGVLILPITWLLLADLGPADLRILRALPGLFVGHGIAVLYAFAPAEQQPRTGTGILVVLVAVNLALVTLLGRVLALRPAPENASNLPTVPGPDDLTR